HRALTLGLLLTVSSTAFEALAVATILPAAVREIGGVDLYGWAFSGFMLTNLFSITLAGRLIDQRGPAPTFIAGSILFSAGLVVAGMAPSMIVVVFGRTAQGLGAGAISSAAYVAVARGYPADTQPRMLAMLSSAWVVPGLIGPALAGSIADYAGWRWVFLGLVPLMATAASLAVPVLRRFEPASVSSDQRGRIRAALALAAGTAAVLYGLGSTGAVLIALLSLSVGVVLAVPAMILLTPPGTLQARPGLPAAVATMALLSFAFFGAEAFLPLALTTVRGQSTTVAGMVLTAATLAWTSGAWIQARLDARHSRRALTVYGLALTFTGVAGTALVLFPQIPVALAALTWGISGLGIGIAYSTITLVVLAAAPAGSEGTASAAMQLANVLGVALGTGFGGAILSAATSRTLGIASIDAIAVLAAGFGILTAARLPGGMKSEASGQS
ncbi:MAG TPA: MFS transporter, partial [Candidatus Acidoferrales bacterium]|nr:MFS transporter [Candidatus Acidoferrales bacterium]